MEHLVFYFQIQVDKVTSQVSKNTVERNYDSNVTEWNLKVDIQSRI